MATDVGKLNLAGISWVIVGGESGPGARPMKREWVISLRDQCRKARVQFFFKQWGGIRKHLNGRELDGRTYDGAPSHCPNPIPIDAKRLHLIGVAEAEAANFVSVEELARDWGRGSTRRGELRSPAQPGAAGPTLDIGQSRDEHWAEQRGIQALWDCHVSRSQRWCGRSHHQKEDVIPYEWRALSFL